MRTGASCDKIQILIAPEPFVPERLSVRQLAHELQLLGQLMHDFKTQNVGINILSRGKGRRIGALHQPMAQTGSIGRRH